jgi:hypothetical protein
MAYTKQELIDWITEELPEDAAVTFIAAEVGEEAVIDDLIMPVEGGDLDEEELECYGVEEETSHIIFLA